MILQILQYLAITGTLLTGLYSIFWPMKVRGFTGLEVNGGRGITEIRSVLGAMFVGLAGAALVLNSPQAFAMLGIAYLAIAVVRGISMFVDDSLVSSNYISLGVELVFGFILIL
jgi:hypothetical protein